MSTETPSPALLLRRLGDELVRQAEAIRALHALAEGGGDAALAQTIDIASQHVDEVARILKRLSPHAGTAFAVAPDVLEPIRLSGLRARLAGLDDEAAAAGELDLF